MKRNRLAVGKSSILVRGNRRYSLLLGLLLAALHVIMAEDWYSTAWSDLLEMDQPPPKYERYNRPDTALHRMLARMLVPDDDEDDS